MIGIAEHELEVEEDQGIGFDELRAALDRRRDEQQTSPKGGKNREMRKGFYKPKAPSSKLKTEYYESQKGEEQDTTLDSEKITI